MNPDPRVVFVGQGPNRKVWERGQALALKTEGFPRMVLLGANVARQALRDFVFNP